MKSLNLTKNENLNLIINLIFKNIWTNQSYWVVSFHLS